MKTAYTKGYNKKRKEEKRAEAESRQAVYDRLSIDDRIKQAKSRPGESKKELAKLQALKDASKPKK